MQMLLTLLFPGDHRRSVASLIGRAAILLFLICWTWSYFFVRLRDLGPEPGVMHLVHLVFHEAGHTITAMLTNNRTMIVFMGSGLQVLFPLIVTVSFYFTNKDAFGAALGLWWTGHAMLDVAPYIGDARSLDLQLLGGGTGKEVEGHDWEYLLEHWHALNRDIYIAAHVATVARVIMVVAFAWALGSLIYDAYMRDAPDPTASDGSL